jgi:hypothetical protein
MERLTKTEIAILAAGIGLVAGGLFWKKRTSPIGACQDCPPDAYDYIGRKSVAVYDCKQLSR